MKVISLWSAGKDSCLACYKAKLAGHKISFLVNFANSKGENSISHGLSAQIIRHQASLAGIPLIQKAMPLMNYREEFEKLILELKKKEGIEGIVFGDIYLQEHKDWIDKVCTELDVKPVIPLWGQDTFKLAEELIRTNFKAIIVSTRADVLGEEWLGRKIDQAFLNELKKRGGIDHCGEKGEFHTFVYDCPLFKMPVEFSLGKKTLGDNHWFLELVAVSSKEREKVKTGAKT